MVEERFNDHKKNMYLSDLRAMDRGEPPRFSMYHPGQKLEFKGDPMERSGYTDLEHNPRKGAAKNV